MATSEHEQIKAAGGNDVADWGEKKTSGAYAKGTTFDIGGKSFDPSKADEILSRRLPAKGKGKAPVRRS